MHKEIDSWLSRLREFKRAIFYEISVSENLENFSQHGEDEIIKCFFENELGFYIDVGCGLLRKFSSTYAFYRRGWRGIAIDANPDLRILWRVRRRKDTFINAAISDRRTVELCVMEHGFSTTVEKSYSDSLVANHGKKIVKRQVVSGIEIKTILESFFDSITPEEPCFMSIDVEMHDLNLLRTNDWKRFQPRVICIETGDDFSSVRSYQITELLKQVKYRYLRQAGLSSIFVHERFVKH